jgi:hypothetical protein
MRSGGEQVELGRRPNAAYPWERACLFMLDCKPEDETEYLSGHLLKYGSLPPFNATGTSIKRCNEMKVKAKHQERFSQVVPDYESIVPDYESMEKKLLQFL